MARVGAIFHRPKGPHCDCPIVRRISEGVAPPARSSRKPVARVDLDNLWPSASWIKR